jgi:glycosyltransferase involved in cell wall biosynthesis
LVRASIEAHIATTDDNGPGRLDVPLGVPVVNEGVTYWFFRRQTRFYAVSLPLTRWLARHAGDYDLVHIHALFSWAAVAAAACSAWRGVPYVIRPLGTLSRWSLAHQRPLLKRLSLWLVENRVLSGAMRIHYTSELERVEGAQIINRHATTVVPLGVDLTWVDRSPEAGWLRRRAPHLAGRTVLLFMSRLDPKKGLDLLLAAFARLAHREKRLALVVAGSGSSDFELSLHQKALSLGIQDDVLWAGFLEGEEKLSALAEADVFVLPSYSENFGIAVVEAMAHGLPVIISDQVGVSREVTAAGAGIVVSCEVEAIAGAIRHLVTHPEVRRGAGDCGRRLATQRFSVDTMTAGLIQMYEEILREDR